MHRIWFAPAVAVSLVASVASVAPAQCRVPTTSNEAKLLYYYAVPIAYSMPGYVTRVPTGGVLLGGDLTVIPDPDPVLQTTSLCFRQKKESTSLSRVLPRPRLAIGLPLGFVAEATYLPPVTVSGATPNLFSAALARVFALVPTTSLVLRAHTTIGQVQGPITCPASSLQQRSDTLPCFGTKVSRDTYHPNMVGGEAALAWSDPTGRFGVMGGAGVTSLNPRFQVSFVNGNGLPDNTKVEPVTSVTRPAVFAGGYFALLDRVDVNAQVYDVPKDRTVFRVGGSIRLR